MTDDLASALDEIRGRGYRKGTAPGLRAGQLADHAAEDVPRLLAAVEAALKLADDWDNEAVRLDAVVGRSVSGGERATRAKAAAQAHKVCADALHAAITREITGKGERDDR